MADFGNPFKPTQKDKTKLVENLYEIPKKDKGPDMPHFEETEPNFTHQADLLYLPHDGQNKYALVVVDVATGKTDAEPLTSKDAPATLKAFKKIYSRKILSMPERLETDAGAEFKGVVKDYFNNNNVYVRYGKPGRHRQQALAEQRNNVIGTNILKRQTAQELLTGAPSTEWVSDLKPLIKAIDEHLPKKKTYPNFPTGSKKAFDFLPVGTKVRVSLDEPIKVTTGKREHGAFRAGDIRWNPTERTVRQLNLQPGQPPTYLLDGPHGTEKVENIDYTRNQLQVIPSGEKLPHPSVIRGKPTHYLINKIVGKKTVKGKLYYLVNWKGFLDKDNTYELRDKLYEDSPAIVKAYEKLNQ